MEISCVAPDGVEISLFISRDYYDEGFTTPFDYLMFIMRENSFGMSDSEAKELVDYYIHNFPWLLKFHDKNYYYQNV